MSHQPAARRGESPPVSERWDGGRSERSRPGGAILAAAEGRITAKPANMNRNWTTLAQTSERRPARKSRIKAAAPPKAIASGRLIPVKNESRTPIIRNSSAGEEMRNTRQAASSAAGRP